jgi:cytosine/adenosine deaminase-related metal-dependent hydrolase
VTEQSPKSRTTTIPSERLAELIRLAEGSVGAGPDAVFDLLTELETLKRENDRLRGILSRALRRLAVHADAVDQTLAALREG